MRSGDFQSCTMCERCQKLDTEIKELQLRAETAGPDMLPAIELMIAVRETSLEALGHSSDVAPVLCSPPTKLDKRVQKRRRRL